MFLETSIPINERPHKRLEVWKQSIDLVSLVYKKTKAFPREEEFGLTSQLRRAAVSVPSNIAEGLTTRTKNDKLRFLNIAQGSLSEIDTQLEIAKNLEYLDDTSFVIILERLVVIQKLLSGLIRNIHG